MTFREISQRWAWRPIPHCPGRYVFAAGACLLTPEDVLAGRTGVTEHVVSAARDPVAVAPFDDGGLISYRKSNGTYLHTLNSPEGFDRKLRQLGLR